MITENNNIEFKRELTDSIIKEIIAFCNTTGGTIILGYNDNGKVVGLKNAKEDLDRLSRGCSLTKQESNALAFFV